MMNIILQSPHSFETRSIRAASMVLNQVQVTESTFDSLGQHVRKLTSGALPVGSVEFVRKAMHIAGLVEPENLSYPDGSKEYLHRSVKRCNAGEVIGTIFVKPVETKLFTGFVFDTMMEHDQYSEHDQIQWSAFMKISANEKVFVSDRVEWKCEWCYYVAKHTIIGQARYDQNDNEIAPVPNIDVVKACIKSIDLSHPYALDFGVLSTGETALVEVNDAWAIGLYGHALEPKKYLTFLQERWLDIYSKSK